MFEFLALGILASAAIIVLLKWPVSYALVLAAQLGLREWGLAVNSAEGHFPSWTMYAFGVSIVVLCLGYSVGRRHGVLRAHRVSQPSGPRRAWPDRSVMAVVLVAGGLALYHIAIIGPPIFASDIEVSRFDFTSSGLFGVPGRMYLFGTTFAWIIASANAQVLQLRWRLYRPWRVATGLLILLALLSGFKGELLATSVVLISTYVVISGRTLRLGSLLSRFGWALVFAAAYFLIVAGLYQTYATSGKSTWELTWSRLTTVAAEPTQFALTYFGSANGGILTDFLYFLRKYTGQSVGGEYTFERGVSAAIIGVSPSSAAWAPPVTVGAFAELAAFTSVPLALLLIMLVGAALGRVSVVGQSSTTALSVAAILSWAIYTWILKGGLAYHVLNFAIVFLLLVCVAWFVSLVRLQPKSGGWRFVAPLATSHEGARGI